MIEAAAIESTSPSPPITASQSQAVSSRSRPSTNTCFGISGSACTARASAHSEARRILSRSIRAGEAKATANEAVAQISSNSSSRRSGRQPLGIVDALGDPLGIEHHGRGHHRTRQRTAPGLVAAGHRPDAALDQRALAAKARRRHRDHALWQLGRLDLLSDLSRIMPRIVRKRAPPRNRELRAIPVQFASSMSIQLNPADERAGPRRPRCRERPRPPRDDRRDRQNIRNSRRSRSCARASAATRPSRCAKSITASTSSVVRQFQASVIPRNACGADVPGSVTSCAS